MLNNKKVLCLGNNTLHTDLLTNTLAQKFNSINHGLIAVSDFTVQQLGFYHSSLHDLDKFNMLNLAQQFDHVILFDQPLESFDCDTVYYETRHIFNLISSRFKIPTEII